jgi:hypothetical protein
LYEGFSFAFSNWNAIGGIFNDILNGLTNVVNNNAAFQQSVVNALNSSVGLLLNFATSQLGLGNLPNEIKAAVQYVPNKIYTALGAAVANFVLPGNPTGHLYDGVLTKVLTVQSGQYQLWTARDSTTKQVSVKVAQKDSNGHWQMYTTLTDASFTGNNPKTNARALLTAAQNYAAELDRQKKTPTPDGATRLAGLQALVATAQNVLAQDINNNACAATNAGCFAAGTKLWTPEGYRAVEEILEGECVYSRNEYDPFGPIEAKLVEAKFERTGRILHVHLENSALIRTTPEHPFFVEGTGWTAAGALQSGDRIRTDSGWVKVEEIFDTGCYESVYNLRIAQHHTYFVGEERWGWRAWAHNTYEFISGLRVVDMVNGALTSQGTSLTGSDKITLINLIRDNGVYGAVGDYAQLGNTIAKARSSSDALARVTAYFHASGVITQRQTKEADIKRRDDAFDAGEETVRGWTAYINNTYGRDARGVTYTQYIDNIPAGADLSKPTHGHHIVYKKGLGAPGQAAANEASDILLYRGIDPYFGQENLCYAPNQGHPDVAMVEILRNLKNGTQPKSRSQIVAVLKTMALRYIQQTLPGMANAGGGS